MIDKNGKSLVRGSDVILRGKVTELYPSDTHNSVDVSIAGPGNATTTIHLNNDHVEVILPASFVVAHNDSVTPAPGPTSRTPVNPATPVVHPIITPAVHVGTTVKVK